MKIVFLKEKRDECYLKLEQSTSKLYFQTFMDIYKQVKTDNKKSRELIKEFQYAIKKISIWNVDEIKAKHKEFISQCVLFDNIVKSIFKIHLAIYNVVNESEFDANIPQPGQYLHETFLNIARRLWKEPLLIYDVKVDKTVYQTNLLRIHKIIKKCIRETFLQMLPFREFDEHLASEAMNSNSSPDDTDNSIEYVDETADEAVDEEEEEDVIEVEEDREDVIEVEEDKEDDIEAVDDEEEEEEAVDEDATAAVDTLEEEDPVEYASIVSDKLDVEPSNSNEEDAFEYVDNDVFTNLDINELEIEPEIEVKTVNLDEKQVKTVNLDEIKEKVEEVQKEVQDTQNIKIVNIEEPVVKSRKTLNDRVKLVREKIKNRGYPDIDVPTNSFF
jgi:hypothetical protein